MSFDGEETRWMCGRSGVVNLQRVSSIVREIREPCLYHSPKGSKILKPEKWQTVFDSDGKVVGFRKVLKLITLGGVDPSIRAEVWEFLLGCYALNSTAEYRRQLRLARRERYADLVRQCQIMHPSIGTGTLATMVGSKVMDMRTSSKDDETRGATTKNRGSSYDISIGSNIQSNHDCTETSCTHLRRSLNGQIERVNVRSIVEDEVYNCFSTTAQVDKHEAQCVTESFFDFPSVPAINLLCDSDRDTSGAVMQDDILSAFEHPPRYDDEHMHSFQISNNMDLIMESSGYSDCLVHGNNNENKIVSPDAQGRAIGSKEMRYNAKTVNGLRISDVPKRAMLKTISSSRQAPSEDRVSEWLWTLHQIVVDVVRTDSHLEFYKDAKNTARMSDILAVYAWVDPTTGYCQGMSDLLSPFVVLYEDNADAFWCFEMLLRRMRDNFQMEGLTGVMKQLQALWKILELTDAEMFEHLSAIGAESLHFAFRMLLVLFRRELSFNEALCMWEMMWAADFDEALAHQLEENCLEPLNLQPKKTKCVEKREVKRENSKRKYKCLKYEHSKEYSCSLYGSVLKSISNHPFCGFTKANFWARIVQLQGCTTASSVRSGDDDLPVFCVAAILIINRQKIIRRTRSIDDVIKMFNDNKLKINVKRCICVAIKLRKKYLYKLNKQTSNGSSDQTLEG